MFKSFLSRSLLLLSILLFGIFGWYYETGLPAWLMLLGGMLAGAACYIVFSYLLKGLRRLGQRVPQGTYIAILATLATAIVVKEAGLWMPDQVYFGGLLIFIVCLLMIAISIPFVRKKGLDYGWKTLAILGIWVPLGVMVWCVNFLQKAGHDPYASELPAPFEGVETPLLSASGLADPTDGDYLNSREFTYGHGNDKHRHAYAEGLTYFTPTVDASRLLTAWKGKKKKWRERYLGYGIDSLPLNGTVEMPKGKGPFPLALIVHGNHDMIDYSDEGYGNMQSMLAAKGIIAVSVDENFINAHWSGDFRGKEMPARAWILLKHLEQWQQWNADSTHDLYQQVDMDKIMLVGHSRGGEAVSIAAAFNDLPYFPDDANEKFDFHFGIKGIVPIAPTDYRYHRQISLKDISYLSLQGSYDADENSFWGMRPYHRLQFSDSSDHFKAGVYIHRANHGQFNNSWGRRDFGPPSGWLLNTKPLLGMRDQIAIGNIFIGAFAEAVLKGNRAYVPLFQQVACGRDWLPQTHYLSHYQDGDDIILQDFEENINLAEGRDGITISTRRLAVWREEKLGTRGSGSQENHAVILGWDQDENEKDDFLPSYSLEFAEPISMDSAGHLLLSIAAGDYHQLPDNPEDRSEPQLDFHIQLTDTAGARAQLAVSDIKTIAPRLKVQFMKTKGLSEDQVGKAWEMQLDGFHFPISAFEKISPNFDQNSIKLINLVFDMSPYGVVAIDKIGYSPN
jgi:hypothetical protein